MWEFSLLTHELKVLHLRAPLQSYYWVRVIYPYT